MGLAHNEYERSQKPISNLNILKNLKDILSGYSIIITVETPSLPYVWFICIFKILFSTMHDWLP